MFFESVSEQDTINLGLRFGRLLNNGDVVVLSGDLGAGKTKFTTGVLKYFGLEKDISSPTFTIVNEHSSGSKNIYHFDVYRLNDFEEFLAIGGEEYFEKGICIIEWGEKIEPVLPKEYIKLTFESILEEPLKRKITAEVVGNNTKYKEMLEAL